MTEQEVEVARIVKAIVDEARKDGTPIINQNFYYPRGTDAFKFGVSVMSGMIVAVSAVFYFAAAVEWLLS